MELLPGKGAVVTRPTMTDAVENAELIIALETLAIGLACERASEQQLKEIRKLHEQMRQCNHRHDITAYFELNNAVLAPLLQPAVNAALISVHVTTQRHITRLQNLSGALEAVSDESFLEHEEFITALQERNADKATGALKTHLASTLEKIKERIMSSNP